MLVLTAIPRLFLRQQHNQNPPSYRSVPRGHVVIRWNCRIQEPKGVCKIHGELIKSW